MVYVCVCAYTCVCVCSCVGVRACVCVCWAKVKSDTFHSYQRWRYLGKHVSMQYSSYTVSTSVCVPDRGTSVSHSGVGHVACSIILSV
jgi:hypothetical protein